jgi:hypothetical protein
MLRRSPWQAEAAPLSASLEVRREVPGGLQVADNWNSGNTLIFSESASDPPTSARLTQCLDNLVGNQACGPRR